MKKILLLLSALCIFTNAETVADPAQRAAARELVKAAGVRENIEDGFAKMMPVIEQRAASLGLNKEKKDEFVSIYKAWFKDDVDKEKMITKTVDLYCETFTTEEIKELTLFYKSNLGNKFINKLSELNHKTTGFGVQEGQLKQPQLMARLKPFLEKNAPEAIAPPATKAPKK